MAASIIEKTPQILQFNTTVIYVENNVKNILNFYVTAFGFQIKYYDDNLKFGELETGGPTIMISSYQAGEFMVGSHFERSKDKRPSDIELAFMTPDVPTAYARAIASGAKSVREPKTFDWGQTAAYVNSIEDRRNVDRFTYAY